MSIFFGERLKQLRKASNMTQDELGEKMYCDRYRIMDLERGKSGPTIDDIVKLCNVFDVSADYLLGLTDVAYPEYAIDVDGFLKKCKESADTVRKCLDKLMKNDKIFDYQTYAFFETKLRMYEYDIPGLVKEYLTKRSEKNAD